MKTETKRQKEKKVIEEMISLYCRKNHHTDELCDECKSLLDYAHLRIDRCPFMETKTFCNNCKVHCYQKEKREQIKTVMRYSGPRILMYHPIMVLRHMYLSWKEKQK